MMSNSCKTTRTVKLCVEEGLEVLQVATNRISVTAELHLCSEAIARNRNCTASDNVLVMLYRVGQSVSSHLIFDLGKGIVLVTLAVKLVRRKGVLVFMQVSNGCWIATVHVYSGKLKHRNPLIRCSSVALARSDLFPADRPAARASGV